MSGFLKLLGFLAGGGFIVGGGLFLLSWYRHRKYPDQKKMGFAFIAMGVLLILAESMGWF